MKVHHLNCGSFCPKLSFLDDISHCHCLLIEGKSGLVLIDTGIGKRDHNLLFKSHASMLGVDYDNFLTAKEEIKRLNFKPSDVKHILLTHLDFDHAGGLLDFPNATLHLSTSELSEANKSKKLLRYQKELWKTHKKIISYDTFGEDWNGLQALSILQGFEEEILIIPLPGHTKGHCGFAINTPQGWMFHVGDAYYNHVELSAGFAKMKYSAFARLTCFDNDLRLKNLERIKKLKAKKKVLVFCSHDPDEFKNLSSSS